MANRLEPAVTSSRLAEVGNSMTVRFILLGIIGAALALHLFGIQRDLPFNPEIDEPHFVSPAVLIAGTGDLNPREFENPGSTLIYPLAGIYHVWFAAAHDGTLLSPDPRLIATFESDPSDFYLLGRLLTIFYAVMAVPLIFLIGRRAFGERVALIGSALSVLYPIAVTHAQMVRTDSAAVFFGALGLWLCLRLYDRPTTRNQILAGFAIGLAIATRYFVAALIPVLLAVDAMILWRQSSQAQKLRATWFGIGAGVLAVAVGFAVTTPYFFLDFTAAWEEITFQAQHSTHLGADALSRPENFLWYLTRAIPLSITWPETILAASGVALAVWRRRPKQILLVLFTVVFLLGISRGPLHWQRWIIQILPMLALFAAYGLNAVIERLSAHLSLTLSAQRGLVLLAAVLLAVSPAYELVLQDFRQATPSTRLLAREWMLRNLPAGSRIVAETHTVPPDLGTFMISKPFSLVQTAMGGELDGGYQSFQDDGYQYAIASGILYDLYVAEPDRYADEIVSYQTLFAKGRLLQEFRPSSFRGGPLITIYEIEEP